MILEEIEQFGFYYHYPDRWDMNKEELDGLLSNLFIIQPLSHYYPGFMNSEYIFIKYGNPDNVHPVIIENYTKLVKGK